jgi:hypothetical protein
MFHAFTLVGKGTVLDWCVASAKVVNSLCLIASTVEEASGKCFQKAGAKLYRVKGMHSQEDNYCAMKCVFER